MTVLALLRQLSMPLDEEGVGRHDGVEVRPAASR